MGTDMRGLSVDDQMFLFFQSIGYFPDIPLWKYQQVKREMEERSSRDAAPHEGGKDG
jgi:hypothetical protein